jgi:hypothetical protein
MHPTVENWSVGVLGYLRRVMGNVRLPELSVGAVSCKLLVSAESYGVMTLQLQCIMMKFLVFAVSK